MTPLRYAAFRFPQDRAGVAGDSVWARLGAAADMSETEHYRYNSGDMVLGWVVVEAASAVDARSWANAWSLPENGLEVVSAGSLQPLTEDGSLEGVEPTHLLPVTYAIDGADLEDLDRWYVQEHTGLLLTCPDWHRVRRFATTDVVGVPWTRVILHDLTSAAVLQSTEVIASMSTEWRTRLAQTPWFLAGGREILERRR